MYAVIETGGKQYRVEKGEVLRIEKLPTEKGEKVLFDRVLLVKGSDDLHVGKPYVDKANVEGKVVAVGRGKKIIVFKYKAKKNYRRKQGHRQSYTEVLIESINL